MVFTTSFFTLALLGPPLVPVQRAEEHVNGSYIILLRDNVSLAEIVNSNVTNQWDIINGFGVRLAPRDLEAIRTCSDILSIQGNGAVRTALTATWIDAPWVIHLSPAGPANTAPNQTVANLISSIAPHHFTNLSANVSSFNSRNSQGTKWMSGTLMIAPHTPGLIAYLLGIDSSGLTLDGVSSYATIGSIILPAAIIAGALNKLDFNGTTAQWFWSGGRKKQDKVIYISN